MSGIITGEPMGVEGEFRIIVDDYIPVEYNCEALGSDMMYESIWVFDGIVDVPPVAAGTNQVAVGWCSDGESPFNGTPNGNLYAWLDANGFETVQCATPKANNISPDLAYRDAQGEDDQWHKTDSDMWYFPGPYYTQEAKFKYKTTGLKAEDVQKIEFKVKAGTTEYITIEGLALSHAYTPITGFKGHLNKVVPTQKNYLEPGDTEYEAILIITLKVGAPIEIAKKFKV